MRSFREIIFNERSMLDFGFYLLKGAPIVTIPKRNISTSKIMGSKFGDVLDDEKTYQNVDITYSFRSVPSKVPEADEDVFLMDFSRWLQKAQGSYIKLYDSARIGYYRRAALIEISDITRNFAKCYDISLTFSIQPYWYSDFGQEPVYFTAPGETTFELNNPEDYISYPYFKIKNDTSNTDGFALEVNGKSLEVSTCPDYIEIDSEEGQAFKGKTPKNSLVRGDALLTFQKGINTIRVSPQDSQGTATSTTFKIEIVPRWRSK